MSLTRFVGALRILHSLDLADLVEADVLPKYSDGNLNSGNVISMWLEFQSNRTTWFTHATEHQQAQLWALIESRLSQEEANVAQR
jgi:hypothetical protein